MALRSKGRKPQSWPSAPSTECSLPPVKSGQKAPPAMASEVVMDLGSHAHTRTVGSSLREGQGGLRLSCCHFWKAGELSLPPSNVKPVFRLLLIPPISENHTEDSLSLCCTQHILHGDFQTVPQPQPPSHYPLTTPTKARHSTNPCELAALLHGKTGKITR